MSHKKVLVKDGGFATQLSVHVGDKIDGDPLWSARINATNPNAIVKTHLDFLYAGADIILTNTYQSSIEGYIEYLKLNKKESIALIEATVKLAHLARDEFIADKPNNSVEDVPMIIASIGPYGAHLHDGSEYTGSYVEYVSPDIIRKWHQIRIEACLRIGVDALAIETIPCQIEADILIDLLCDQYPNVKFWISFQCKDGTSLAHGESFRNAALAIWEHLKKKDAIDNCIAIGVNCVHPKFVTSLFHSLNGNRSDNQKLPLVVYPNSGEVYDVKNGWTGREDCVPLESYVQEWVQLGAIIIGGCCRTYATDIARIKESIFSLKHKKTI